MFHLDPTLIVLIVYDYGISPSDLAGEKILLINERLIDVRIKVHGPPPTDLQTQRDWYQDVLRDSLKVAAKTRLVLPKKSEKSSEQQDISNSSIISHYSQRPSASGAQGPGYNPAHMAEPHDMTPGFQMTATQESQVSSMSSHHPGLTLPASNFLRNDQQHTSLMTALPGDLVVEASAPSDMMAGEITDLDQWDFQQDMTDATGQLFDPQGNFGFTEDYDVPFEASGPDMLGHTQDQSYWLRQQGKR
jgi:hypothetical protein